MNSRINAKSYREFFSLRISIIITNSRNWRLKTGQERHFEKLIQTVLKECYPFEK